MWAKICWKTLINYFMSISSIYPDLKVILALIKWIAICSHLADMLEVVLNWRVPFIKISSGSHTRIIQFL